MAWIEGVLSELATMGVLIWTTGQAALTSCSAGMPRLATVAWFS